MRNGLLIALACLTPLTASAQEPSRVFVFAGAVSQPTKESFSDATRLPWSLEELLATGVYDVDGGVGVDLGAGVRLAGPVGVLASVNQFTRDTSSSNSFTAPHPFFFNRDRQFSVTQGGLDLRETFVNVSGALFVPTSPQVQVVVFGGPTFVRFEQGVVENFDLIENYPYDSITDVRLTTGTISDSAMGFHVGVDVAWFLSPHVGVGGVVRLIQSSKRLSIGEGDPFDLSLGGVQFGAGVRFRFGE